MKMYQIKLDPTRHPVTREKAIQELRRELKAKWRFYPRWVAAGKITKDTAERRIAYTMAAIEMLEKPQVGLDL